MKLSLGLFCPFALKTPVHAPKIGVWEDFTPKMGSNILGRIQKMNLKGPIQEVWGRKSPSGVQGRSPGRGLGDEVRQKLTTFRS